MVRSSCKFSHRPGMRSLVDALDPEIIPQLNSWFAA